MYNSSIGNGRKWPGDMLSAAMTDTWVGGRLDWLVVSAPNKGGCVAHGHQDLSSS